jgi:hypothetical protein
MAIQLYDSIRGIQERVALFQHLTLSQLEGMLKGPVSRAGTTNKRPVKASAVACRELVASFPTTLSFFESHSTVEPVLSELRMAELRYAAFLVLVYVVRADDLATKTGNGDYGAITSTLLLNMATRDLLSEDEIFVEWYVTHGSREQAEKLLAWTNEVCAFLTDCLPAVLAEAVQELEKGMSSSLRNCREYAVWNLDVLDSHTRELMFNPLVAEPALKPWASVPSSERVSKTIPDVAMRRSDLLHRVQAYDLAWEKFRRVLDSPYMTVVIPGRGSVTATKLKY